VLTPSLAGRQLPIRVDHRAAAADSLVGYMLLVERFLKADVLAMVGR
jgi:hypothetical protein